VIPARTRSSNFVYRGPSPDIGDAWVERRPMERAVYLTWKPSDEERAAIAGGGNIRLGIFNVEPIPPVSLDTIAEPEISSAAAMWRDRAMAILKRIAAGPSRVPTGFWAVSPDVWAALQRDGALDGGDGVPTLISRPLLETGDGPADSLEFIAREPAESVRQA
jgi:hypothetical protein